MSNEAQPSSSGITFRQDETDLPTIMHLIDNELSEPYSIFTYRYFLHNWPNLCYFAYDGDKPFGTVVCKMDVHRDKLMRGYVAMLVVDKTYRGKGVGSDLVKLAIAEMSRGGCEEVALEAEMEARMARAAQGLDALSPAPATEAQPEQMEARMARAAQGLDALSSSQLLLRPSR
eukprot:gene20406-27186_t